MTIQENGNTSSLACVTEVYHVYLHQVHQCRGESCTTWPRLWYGARLEAATRRGRQSVSLKWSEHVRARWKSEIKRVKSLKCQWKLTLMSVERRWRRNIQSGRDYSCVWSSEAPEDFCIHSGRSAKCEAALSSWSIFQSFLHPSRRCAGLAYIMFAFFLLPAVGSCLL